MRAHRAAFAKELKDGKLMDDDSRRTVPPQIDAGKLSLLAVHQLRKLDRHQGFDKIPQGSQRQIVLDLLGGDALLATASAARTGLILNGPA